MIQRIVLIALAVFVLAGLLVWSQRQPPIEKVSGVIEADEIRLGSRVGGRVKMVHADEGDAVNAGDPLVELEEFDLRDRLAEAVEIARQRSAEYDRLRDGYRKEEIAQAAARYQQALAQVDQAERDPREEEVKAAQAQIRLSNAQLERAQQTQRRLVDLSNKQAGSVSQDQLDRAAEDVKVAMAQVDVRQQELAILLLGSREEERREARARADEAKAAWELTRAGYEPEEVAAAQAALEAAKASVKITEEQLAELTIRASVNGIVEAIELQPGDLVTPSAPVLSLLDANRLWVRAYVPQGRLDIRRGEKLKITVDAYPGHTFQGEVTFVAREAEFTPSNVQTYDERAKQMFRIKVTLEPVDDPKIELRPGMTVDVWLKKS